MKKTFHNLLALAIIALPPVYLVSIYSGLPSRVPIHWGIRGAPDAYGNKSSLWAIVLLLAAVASGVYLLIRNLPRIDPKKTVRLSADLFQQIALAVAAFLSALSIAVLYATLHDQADIARLIVPIVGIFFMYLGIVMSRLTPNYFVGLRLPWTLENEDNWRATHQMGSKLWFAGGAVITVAGILTSARTALIIVLSCVFVLVLVPVVFSFMYFKKHSQV